ncbi:hypothetical protein E2562_012831 [Oryza meyeriana var. granulata]|uniref:Uncharacterized protein n=1 Tax=Oryza meyeriana var. granulata TaxID=110450 RepID=A0A6G1CPK6_9ORYZ|nr:hypothetical protein E2562_012831 [Oryza meyeriana var. granulata]
MGYSTIYSPEKPKGPEITLTARKPSCGVASTYMATPFWDEYASNDDFLFFLADVVEYALIASSDKFWLAGSRRRFIYVNKEVKQRQSEAVENVPSVWAT